MIYSIKNNIRALVRKKKRFACLCLPKSWPGCRWLSLARQQQQRRARRWQTMKKKKVSSPSPLLPPPVLFIDQVRCKAQQHPTQPHEPVQALALKESALSGRTCGMQHAISQPQSIARRFSFLNWKIHRATWHFLSPYLYLFRNNERIRRRI